MTMRVLVPRRIDGDVPSGDVATLRGRSMGSSWAVTFVNTGGNNYEVLAQGIEATLLGVVEQMSTWEPDSAITQFNRAAPGSWLPLSPQFALVLGCALHVARASGGALDPTAGEFAMLWGFGPAGRYNRPGFVIPSAAQIEAARQVSGWDRLRVDAKAMRVHQPGAVALDLSAVAKGFAVDEVSRYLRGAGVAHHLVEIGGELRGAGMKPDGQPWWVDVQRPPEANDIAPTRIALHGLAVASSGDSEQRFDSGGRRFSHCIDPRTGWPIDNGVRAVTVLHATCMEADAWSTALMVLGPEAGLVIAEAEQLAVQWLVSAGDVVTEHTTAGWRDLITGAA